MKDWKYILYVGGAFALFIAVKLLGPKEYDWTVTYDSSDKNPYGGYALGQLLNGFFPGVTYGYQTIYELKDSLTANDNVLIITSTFDPGKEDVNALLEFISNGGNVLISAHSYGGLISDTLGIKTNDFLFSENRFEQTFNTDTSWLKFSNPAMDTFTPYFYRRNNIHSHFTVDTTGYSMVAVNDHYEPVSVVIKFGNGRLFLNSTPMVFTNIYMLSHENHQFISSSLSYLPDSRTYWTGYYHLGRMESATPLRFILSTEPLRWAYYIAIGTLILFILFEAKRKQRVIPVVKPPENKSLEFVTTIGNLYFQRGDHKNLAEKKITYLKDQIRSRYLITNIIMNEGFIKTLALKSGQPENDIRDLVNTIIAIEQSERVTEGQLMDLNSKIENLFG